MKSLKHSTTCITLAFICLSVSVHAADVEGRFIVKGGGRIDCGQFLTAMEAKGTEYISLAGWLEGYLSFANQQEPDTFDLAPWQSTELLLSAIAGHCRQHPEKSFHQSAFHLLQGLKAGRLARKSEPVTATVGERSVVLHADIVMRLQQKLKLRGLLVGEPTGLYDKATVEAVRRFQRDKELPITGLPDQLTLVNLL